MIDNLNLLINNAAKKYGLNNNEFSALIYSEYNPRQWVSSAGAIGPAQLMPGTADEMGVMDINDPAQNIEGGARYFKKLLEKNNGDLRGAVQQYKGIRDPSKPENAKMMGNYFDWLRRKTKEDAGGAYYQNDPTTPNNLKREPDNAGAESANDSTWGDIWERLKNPPFIILVVAVLMLSSAAFFELSVKSALTN